MGLEWPLLLNCGRASRTQDTSLCDLSRLDQHRTLAARRQRPQQDAPARRRSPRGRDAGDPIIAVVCQRSGAAADAETLIFLACLERSEVPTLINDLSGRTPEIV